jgi:hypothetical protein
MLLESIEKNISNGIHIIKAVCLLNNFILQQESHKPELIENEITGPGD